MHIGDRRQRPTLGRVLVFRCAYAAFRSSLDVGPSCGSTEVVDTVVEVEANAQIPIVRTATVPRNVNVASIIELISIIVLTSLLR